MTHTNHLLGDSMTDFIPFALPSITEEEITEVVDTLRSGWLTTGPKTKKFEDLFCDYLKRDHAIAVNSCTAGLHLALEAVGVTNNDIVITTVYTFTATAEVIRYLGADPIFVDIDPVTKNIDLSLLESAIEKYSDRRIKAIIPVHFAGVSCDMDAILDLAHKHDITVVEDAAHALPSLYKGKLIGSFGDITVFSFYATKTLATGEGGMVVTDNEEWASRIKTMRLHGISRDVFDRYSSKKPSWYYEVVAPGYKYNMTDIAAALGIHQLKRLIEMRDRRAEIASKYIEAFKELPIELPYHMDDNSHSWHLFTIEIVLNKIKISRDDLISAITEKGIGLSVHFIPLHMHPYWKDLCSITDADFPIASNIFSRTISLPIYPSLTDKNIDHIIDTIKQVIKENTIL